MTTVASSHSAVSLFPWVFRISRPRDGFIPRDIFIPRDVFTPLAHDVGAQEHFLSSDAPPGSAAKTRVTVGSGLTGARLESQEIPRGIQVG